MKLLCLHGAYANAATFQVQLRPFLKSVAHIEDLEFVWTTGAHPAIPPEGFETYFGTDKLFRHVDFDGTTALDDIMFKLGDVPRGQTVEESMRMLAIDAMYSTNNINSTIDRLFRIIDEDPDIVGVLGYSEGATVAATLLLEEQRRSQRGERTSRLKMGVFFSGWPPVMVLNENEIDCVLADKHDVALDVPTLHIIGSKDPYLDGAIALYHVCEPEAAVLFDHGRGHTLPRDESTLKELSHVIDRMLRSSTQTQSRSIACP